MDHANLKSLRALDLDSSDNVTEDMMQRFLHVYGPQLNGEGTWERLYISLSIDRYLKVKTTVALQ